METKPIQWQYTAVPLLGEDESTNNPSAWLDVMNALGTGGWELVGIYKDTLIFKKQC